MPISANAQFVLDAAMESLRLEGYFAVGLLVRNDKEEVARFASQPVDESQVSELFRSFADCLDEGAQGTNLVTMEIHQA
jgi:hypothetical protein